MKRIASNASTTPDDAEEAPILPSDLWMNVFLFLHARNLARIVPTSKAIKTQAEAALRWQAEAALQRAATRGRAPGSASGFSTRALYLAWLECRRDEVCAPVAVGGSVSIFVAEGGRLMSCGDDEYNHGLLGHGEIDFIPEPEPLPSMVGIRITDVAAGEYYNLAVSDSGAIYVWGSDELIVGVGEGEVCAVPKRVHALAGHRVLSVAAGGFHCLVVTEAGELFSWGYDMYGQCGHGIQTFNEVFLPRHVEALAGIRVRNASVGSMHSLVVADAGAIYSFGCHTNGQLGRSIIRRFDPPARVDALRHVRIVGTAAGEDFSLAHADDGTVFSWGGNCFGQLGIGSRGGVENMPQRVLALSGHIVCSLVTSGHSCAAVTATGELFTWGDSILEPNRVEGLRGEWIVAVSIGRYVGTIAVTRSGTVFGWGYVKGLGLPEAAADDGERVFSPCRYQQLSCML